VTINRLSVVTIWVTDQNEALRFYTEKLGFEIRADITNYGYRWLTVGLKGQPDLEFHLAALKPGGLLTQEDVDQLTKLVEAGKIGTGPWKTDDCQKTYETLKARGVDFVQPPTDRPYGTIEAVFKDNSGNIMVLAQDKPHQQA
jgi:catechol 2,3-dioxygenase-like lactoylglutathione lyase family enzyme